MTELRRQMNDAMILRGFSLRTRETYLACVSSLARHYRCSPDQLDAQQIQAYLLYLIQERKLAYASVNQAASACRFLFGKVLQQRKMWLDIPMAKVPQRLPVVLPRADIGRLFAACTTLRMRSVLMTNVPAPDPTVIESVAAFMQRMAKIEWGACPHCGKGHFVVTGSLAPLRASGASSRGPPCA